jgi:small redox-active disulfide protein 2
VLIKVLGPGCANCHALERITRQALTELGITAQLTNVTDYADIAGYGVLSTPALVINDQVVLAGRVPTLPQVRALLSAASAA